MNLLTDLLNVNFIQILLWKNVFQFDLIDIFLGMLCHVSVDVRLHLEEEDQSDWLGSDLNAVLFKIINLVLALGAEVKDEAIPVSFNRQLLAVKLGFVFKHIGSLDRLSDFFKLTFEAA
jgi:hypothetical protein